MITIKYLDFINEDVETKTVLGNLLANISKVNNPLKDKKSKILKEISTTKTADNVVIEEGETYYTYFDSSTLKNGDNSKQIKISVPFNKGYLTYVSNENGSSSTTNKIYGYLIVKDKSKLDILKGVELLKYHERILQKGSEPIKTETKPEAKQQTVKPEGEQQNKTEVKPEAKPVNSTETKPVAKPENKTVVKPEVQTQKPEVTNKPI